MNLQLEHQNLFASVLQQETAAVCGVTPGHTQRHFRVCGKCQKQAERDQRMNVLSSYTFLFSA
jgi:hypothetical protein